jgi:NADPH-dependent glutamate synthase beta subunit-like oxidoreductase
VSISIAIVGSGPAGLYSADAISKARPDARIDVIDRLPTPFGLVRTGVAPDHQSIKKVDKALGRVFAKENVRFLGAIEIGRDVGLAELREIYDGVLLACGAPVDRPLGVSGSELPGVYGSAAFVNWYNGHPDFYETAPDIDVEGIAVVGVGNVALDVARLLAKTPPELDDSDIPRAVRERMHAARIKNIYVLGRRGPIDAKFSPAELREMGHFEDAISLVDAGELPDDDALAQVDKEERTQKEKNIALLREFAAAPPREVRRTVHFKFYSSPVAVLGDDRVRGLRVGRTKVAGEKAIDTGETYDLEVGCVISAIGYVTSPLPGLDERGGQSFYKNDAGRIDRGLWVVGWARRGPTGTIATNRTDAQDVVARMLGDLNEGRPGPQAIDTVLAARSLRPVFFADWERIDAHERSLATSPCPRVKLLGREALLGAAFAK